MTIAICLKCGAEKIDALTECPKCGFNPENSSAEDQVMSILLGTPEFAPPLPEPELKTEKTEPIEIPDFDPKLIEQLTDEIESGPAYDETDENPLRRYALLIAIAVLVVLAGIIWWFLR